MKNIILKFIFLFSIVISLVSCISEEKPNETSSLVELANGEDPVVTTFMEAGDLVVTNYSGDSAILLDSDGDFKKILYNVKNNQEQVVGVGWNPVSGEVLLTVNGYPDRLVGITASDGTERVVIQNNQYSGNTFGVAVDGSGDYLLIESHQVEKFDSNGNRVNDGNFPTGTLITNLSQITMLANGGFLVCGYGGDLVATYNSIGTQTFNTSSGIAATTNAYGCHELSDGSIATGWDGTTDTINIYNSDLSSVLASYSDTTNIVSPKGIEILSNGNILVADSGYHYLVELTYNSSAGTLSFVRSFGGGVLNYPWQVLEIPTF